MAELVKSGGRESTLAILFDAENTPAAAVSDVLVSCASLGRAVIMRAYGDWTIDSLKSWRSIFAENPIVPIQQFHLVSGNNSSDSVMNIDAMDIIHEGRVDTFVLVTSDSDFTRLATRVREAGLNVVGFGRMSAVRSFVKACHQFIYLENLSPRVKEERPEKARSQKKPKSLVEVIDGKELLLKAAQACTTEDGSIVGSQLGLLLKRLDPGFSPQNYGVSRVSDLVAMYPEIIKPTGERSGLSDPIYKFERWGPFTP